MKRKIFAISVLMMACFTAAPGTGFSQDEKAASPDAASSQDEKAASPDAASSQDGKATTPDAASSQDGKATTPDAGSRKGKVMIPGAGSSNEKAAEQEKTLTEYTIVRHDTLWDISKRFLKNPFKWPTIWKQNPYIKNPDLIYPGNMVRISPDGTVEIVKAPPPAPKELPTVVLEEQKEKVVELQPSPLSAKEAKEKGIAMGEAVKEELKTGTPVLASKSMSRKGFISRKQLDSAGVIVEPKEKQNQLYFTQGDTVLVSLKDKESLKKGDRYAIIQEQKKIYHPVTGSYMGNLVEDLGILTITDTNTPAGAMIDKSYKEITRGAKLVPFKETVREVEITGTESEIKGYIIASVDSRNELSEGTIVYIDKGGKDGLKNGNVMRIYRDRKKVSDPLKVVGSLTLPPFELGTVVIIDAGENTSTAIIVKSDQFINPGDRVATVPTAKEVSAR